MFVYGFLSVVLVLYLAQLGLSEGLIGLLLSLTLIGDAAISLWMTTSADRIGRRRILMGGAGFVAIGTVLRRSNSYGWNQPTPRLNRGKSPSWYRIRHCLPGVQTQLSPNV